MNNGDAFDFGLIVLVLSTVLAVVWHLLTVLLAALK